MVNQFYTFWLKKKAHRAMNFYNFSKTGFWLENNTALAVAC